MSVVVSVYTHIDLTTSAALFDGKEMLWGRKYPNPNLPGEQNTRTGVLYHTLDRVLEQVSGILANMDPIPDTLIVEFAPQTAYNHLYWGETPDRYRPLVRRLLASSFSCVPCSINLRRARTPKAKNMKIPVSLVLDEEISLEDALSF